MPSALASWSRPILERPGRSRCCAIAYSWVLVIDIALVVRLRWAVDAVVVALAPRLFSVLAAGLTPRLFSVLAACFGMRAIAFLVDVVGIAFLTLRLAA